MFLFCLSKFICQFYLLYVCNFISLFAGTYYCFSQYVTLRTNPENNKALVFSTDVSSYFNNSNTWLAFGMPPQLHIV